MLFFFHHYELPVILSHQADPEEDLLADPIAALTDEVNVPEAVVEQHDQQPGAADDLQQPGRSIVKCIINLAPRVSLLSFRATRRKEERPWERGL